MEDKIEKDLCTMEGKLKDYVEKGRAVGFRDVKEEPIIAVRPETSNIHPLRRMSTCDVHFMAVDCSTRTLRRANNWGIYLLRVSFSTVNGRDVSWDFEERVRTVIGEAHERRRFLQNARLELESEMALGLINKANENTYLLLDGASYFGGERRFSASLYEKCRDMKITLLALSKQSPTLHDEKGRDFVAAASMLTNDPIWVYHPITKANVREHLYGDVSLIKLSEESPRIFRCDIMDYLTEYPIGELLSPLTAIAEDPRCMGYPIVLWLAHDFSTPSESKLLHHYDRIETRLTNAEILEKLRKEELSCNFGDELHDIKHPYNREWIENI